MGSNLDGLEACARAVESFNKEKSLAMLSGRFLGRSRRIKVKRDTGTEKIKQIGSQPPELYRTQCGNPVKGRSREAEATQSPFSRSVEKSKSILRTWH